MTAKRFSELGLSDELLKAIDALGFEQASPIQALTIPVLMQGRDVVGQSQTGSGKTAAFAIPAIERTDPHLRAPQALVLCPTRELAVQVSEEIHKLALFKRGIHALPIYGGQSYERQFNGLRQGAQIIIGTPGRVMDHMRRGTLRFDQLKLAVLDEVDVMLNMGFREDIELILQATPKERQTVFFSATIPPPIQRLIEQYSRDPQQLRIEQKALTVPTVEQVFYEVDRRFKLELLTRLIDLHDLKLGIIFCNTKRMVDDLVDHLEAQGYMADRLHGDMTQYQRDRVMNKFRKSGLEFLVATDIAARGIDVDDVQVVFNYDLPYDVEDYVHRIGRTGRVGRSGRAITFVSGRELFQIRSIERYANTRIQRGRIPTAAEVEEARENVVLARLRATLQGGQFKRQDHLVECLLEEGFTSADIASASLALLQSFEATTTAAPRREDSERPPRPERERYPAGPRLGTDDRRARDEGRRERLVRPPPPSVRRAAPAAMEPIPAPASERAAATVPAGPSDQASVSPKPSEAPKPPEVAVPPPASVLEVPPPPRPEARAPVQSKPRRETAPPWLRPEQSARRDEPVRAPKKARPAAGEFTRLHMNLGEQMGVGAGDVVGAIAGETGLPAKVVGQIDVRERHLFVDVATEHMNAILARLNRTRIKGNKVRVKVA